jgi:hypothetical protein
VARGRERKSALVTTLAGCAPISRSNPAIVTIHLHAGAPVNWDYESWEEWVEIFGLLAEGPRTVARFATSHFTRGALWIDGRGGREIRAPFLVALSGYGPPSEASERLRAEGVEHICYATDDGRDYGTESIVIIANAVAPTEKALVAAVHDLADAAELLGAYTASGGAHATLPLPSADGGPLPFFAFARDRATPRWHH